MWEKGSAEPKVLRKVFPGYDDRALRAFIEKSPALNLTELSRGFH